MGMWQLVLPLLLLGYSAAMPELLQTVELTAGEVRRLSSPNYPGNYENNENILWLVTAPEGHVINVTILDFDLEDDEFDKLTMGFGASPVEPGAGEIIRLTGSVSSGEQWLSPTRYMWLKFESDVSTTLRGFDLELRVLPAEACSVDQFKCRNGYCIPLNATCDTINDCLDHSDEKYCSHCLDIPLPLCNKVLMYNTTVFPNKAASNITDAEQIFNGTIAAIANCHVDVMTLLCHTIYPQCPHQGPTMGPCFSDCMSVTEACSPVYEQRFQRAWPVDCSDFINSTGGVDRCLTHANDLYNEDICGTRPAYETYESRVVGGVNAEVGEVPWIGSMREEDELGSFHFCGGSLISSEWFITAAHCVSDYVDRIVFGDLQLHSPSQYQQSRTTRAIYKYPGYSSSDINNDLALIRLSEPVKFTDYVRPVCIADVDDEVETYSTCFVSGWGVTRQGDQPGPESLMTAPQPLVSMESCQESHIREDLGFNYTITESMICYGYSRGGVSSCQGDSGGPVVCIGANGRVDLVGAVSWAIGCALPAFPSVAARISQFLPFIESVVNGSFSPGNYEINLHVDIPQNISSPNYPANYDNDEIEFWRVTAPESYRIMAQFIDLALEEDFDYVYFGNGMMFLSNAEIARVTGFGPGRNIISDGRYMWIRFVSDSLETDQGFQLKLAAVKANDTDVTKQFITIKRTSVEVISSPNYPDYYSNVEDMIWIVTAPANHSVRAHFLDFELEDMYDYVTIGDTESPRPFTTVASLTGDELPADVISSDRFMWIRFESDFEINGRGFRVELSAVETVDVDDCSSNPCKNNGTCSDFIGFFECSCLPGIKGSYCQIDLYECYSNPCQHNSSCVDQINGFECQCSPGFYGTLCEYTPCDAGPCSNGGTCVLLGSDIACECARGFTGRTCQIDINECSSLPCQNGGRCEDGAGEYTCSCRPGYGGKNCEKNMHCILEGEWYNDLNDKIILTHTLTGMLLGNYVAYYQDPDASSPVVVGYAAVGCESPSFGLVMSANNGKVTTSWSGQCDLCDGVEVLYTRWTETHRVNACKDHRTATYFGEDKWTRYRQSQLPGSILA